LNFTSLVSGPIQRFEAYRAIETAPATVGPASLGRSAERIVIGFCKVFVVSAVLSQVQQHLIDRLAPDQPFADRIWSSAAIAAVYPVYLYFNFSGYTDFVIGVARWFGLVLPENFNQPFRSENVTIFWNRWHITLSTWLKTYVYQPLVLKLMARFPDRKFEPALVVGTLFITFFLIGAWHGQTSSFLFFGILTGLGVSMNKLYQTEMIKRLGKKRYRELSVNPLYSACGRGLTFTWFSFTLLWFWSDWHQLYELWTRVGTAVLLLAWPVLFIASSVVLAAWVTLHDFALSATWAQRPILLSRYTRTMFDTALLVVVVAVVLLLNAPAPPIVYKNF
jgi:D-alanyl-lipoteichoic acid acyltransferase DltB (MBOAT superfamily)